MKDKGEVIEILKETLSIDGNRGAHQYWITGIEKAADRLTEQPESNVFAIDSNVGPVQLNPQPQETSEERYEKAISELDWKSGKGKELSIHDIRMALYTAAGLNRDILGGEIDPTNKIITE